MKFSCTQKEILRALSVAQKAAPNTGTLSILENVLIEVQGQTVSLSATDLELSITAVIEANVQNEGKTTIPAKTFVSWIGLASDETIEFLKTEGEKIHLKTKSSKTTINGISADEYPILPAFKKEETFFVSQKDLRNALNQVVFAAATGGTRPVLSGVLLQTEENTLILVGTDSYRLSEKRITLKNPPKSNISCIVPAKTLMELERILTAEKDEDIEIVIAKNQILFLFNGIRLVSRLIEGQFPNYQQILPKVYKNEIEIGRQELIRTVKRVGIFARENNHNIKLIFRANEIDVTTDITEIGIEEATIPSVNSGGENSVAVNSQFLLDVLLVLNGDKALLKIGEKLNPITVASKEDTGFLHIIMPLKV